MKKKGVAFTCLIFAFSLHCMDDSSNISKIFRTKIDCGFIPINRIKGNDHTYHLEVQVLSGNRLLVSRATDIDSNDNIELKVGIFDLDSSERVFRTREKLLEGHYHGPRADAKTIFMNNNHTVYFVEKNLVMDCDDLYLRQVSQNGQFILGTETLGYDAEALDALHILDNSAQIIRSIPFVRDIRFISNANVMGDACPKNNACRLVSYVNNETGNREALIANSGEIVILPREASDSLDAYCLSQDEKSLCLLTKDYDKVISCDVKDNTFSFSREFDYFWSISGDNKFVLVYTRDEPFVVWDLQNDQKTEIEGFRAVNRLAKKLGVTPGLFQNGEYSYWSHEGVNRLVFQIWEWGSSIFGMIVDVHNRSARVFDQGHRFSTNEDFKTEGKDIFVRYVSKRDNDRKYYNIAKIKLDGVKPINWLKNVQLKELETRHNSVLQVTHKNGFQEIIQIPEFLRYSVVMEKYFTNKIYQLVYVPQTDRVIVVTKKKNHNILWNKVIPAKRRKKAKDLFQIASCTNQRICPDGEPYALVTYKHGRQERMPLDILKRMQAMAAQNIVLNQMGKQREFHIAIRNASNDEVYQEIDCETYQLVKNADAQVEYLATYNPGEALLLWHVSARE